MRTLRLMALAAIATALVAGSALAQRPGGGGGGSLATNKSVQEELKMTKEQTEKVDEAIKKIREKHGLTDFRKLREMKPEERAELTKKAAEDTTKALGEILKADQTKRLKQIELQQQARSVNVYANEEVQKAMKLTAEQKEKISTISKDLQKDIEELRKNAGNDPAKFREMFTKMQELGKEATTKITSTFSADQKKAWEELTGKPFEVKFERPQPRPNPNP